MAKSNDKMVAIIKRHIMIILFWIRSKRNCSARDRSEITPYGKMQHKRILHSH